MFGTVQAATELEAGRLLGDAWHAICPHAVAFIAIIPGTLAFTPEGEAL